MNKKRVFFCLLICLFVLGCVSLPEPDSKKQTLVVGMINLQAKGYATSYASLNGTTKMGIEISIQELTSKKTYTMTSWTEGLFYSTNIPQGIYGIVRLYIKVESSSGWVTLTQPYGNTTHRIEIVNGKVNNLGLISYNSEKGQGSSLNYNQEYDQVRTLFQKKNGSSNWNNKEWINNGINRANSGGNTPPAVQSGTTTSVTGVVLNKTSITLNMGSSETLTATIIPSNATNKSVTWTSSDTNVVRVSGGTVTAVAPGTAVITASVDGFGVTTCLVAVSGLPASPVASVAQSSQSVQTPAPVTQQNVPAPQKYALVIGNGNYTGLSRLANPLNDANDMAAALQGLGFTVDKVLDGNLDQIENAVMRLKNRLSVSKNSYGFFFYAGHGVQSNGVNYLIPVGATIPSENSLRDRAVSVQWALNELNDAGNELNVVVLDACRDNPFNWARSNSRGLSVIANQPADSIIVYATSAGSTAADGTGRNGLFTTQLLKNIKTPGLDVTEIFRRTGADVAQVSDRKQIPAVYSQFFGTAILSR